MKEYVRENRGMLVSIAGIFAAAALVLLSAMIFNDAGAAVSVIL